jgi:hypothetical protein
MEIIMLSEISQAHKRHFLSFVEAKGKQNKTNQTKVVKGEDNRSEGMRKSKRW